MKKRTFPLLSRISLGLIAAVLALTVVIVPAHAQTLTAKRTSSTTLVHSVAKGPGPRSVVGGGGSNPPCYGSGCFGVDPFTSNCATTTGNVITSKQLAFKVVLNGKLYASGTLYNYYSTWCNANWAEVFMSSSNPGLWLGITTQSPVEEQCYPGNGYCPNNPNSGDPFYFGTGSPIWTNMIDGQNLTTAEVCFNVSNCAPDGQSGFAVPQ